MIRPNKLSRQPGFSLIEVIIATLLLSIAAVGAFSMLITAQDNSNEAAYRAIATDITTEVSERMRSNLPALHSNDEGITEGGSYVQSRRSDCHTTPSAYCSISPATAGTAVTNCTPSQMAVFDMWQLRCRNGINQLPNGTLNVNCAAYSSSSGQIESCAMREITVQWQVKSDDKQSQIVMPFLPAPWKGE